MPPDALGPEGNRTRVRPQFWMELVATNEFEESWLDEGFNTYSTAKVMSKVYGNWPAPLQVFGFNLSSWLGLPKLDDFRLSARQCASPMRTASSGGPGILQLAELRHELYPRTTTFLAHDGAGVGRRDDAAGDADLPAAVPVQASDLTRLRSRGERGFRPWT